jgi:membrane protease YdiL (CAAX protease family)
VTEEEHGQTSGHNLTERKVLFSFYLTQSLFLVIGIPLLWWQGKFRAGYFAFDNIHMWIWGGYAGLTIVALDLLLSWWIPDSLDDGGINRLLFRGRSVPHILLIALMAGVAEEILFRGVIQEWLGVWGTSVMFVLLHTRYLGKWIMAVVVGLISVFFGYMVEFLHNLAPVMIAHSLVDFLLGCYLRFADHESSDS